MRDVTLAVYAPVENEPDDVVVAMVVKSVDTVPYAKPRVVGLAPPVAEIVPFSVAVVEVRLEADWVVRVEVAISRNSNAPISEFEP